MQKLKLGKKAAERWKCILRYLASFLLLSPDKKLWTYMIEYLKLEAVKGRDMRPVLYLLIRVILCVVRGSDFSQILGLMFIRKRKDGVFFLTPVLVDLCSSVNDEVGNIIVETNFRLYAYTSSSLQLAILSTFTEMTYRFHDMSVGILTRESVRRALQVGISSPDHRLPSGECPPAVYNNRRAAELLTCYVSDQIRLWEDERRRLTFSDAALYSAFEGDSEFVGVRDFSQGEGTLLWADGDKKLVVVSDESHEKVRGW
ncbi:unnamed protein product [Heligmosomoides polygyrus]|uniref:General transcription factor IIH subunit 4 n=1 Tax=Heligmosomoides polygyrus TaxID=6339 RepID=A0A3P8BP37_HELPZ|nr:unnamed protein product [Heligmosomoides polygyrus]